MRPPAVALLPVLFAATACLAGYRGSTARVEPRDADSSWAWAYVPDEAQSTYATAVVAEADGAYMAGTYGGGGAAPRWGGQRLDSRGDMNFFIARHGADGAVRWVRRYGDGGWATVAGLARGPAGSLFIVGTLGPGSDADSAGRWDTGTRTLVAFRKSAFVARLDATGSVLWGRFIEGATEVAAVAVDTAGRVYVGGGTGSPRAQDADHAYLAAFSADGAPLWSRVMTLGTTSEATGVTATPYGACVVGHVTASRGSSEGDGGRLGGRGHGFAAGYSHAGKPLWGRALTALPPSTDAPNNVLLNGAASDPAGACYAAGGFAGVLHFGPHVLTSARDTSESASSYGHTDAVVLKFDRGGRPEWATQGKGGPVSDFADAVAVGPGGRVFAVGTFVGTSRFGASTVAVPYSRYGSNPRALFALALAPDGAVLHATQNVLEGTMSGTGIAAARDGSVYVTGMQNGNATFGRIDAPNPGSNAFLAKLSEF